MPVMTIMHYKCPKCGFKITKQVGDVITSPYEFSAPICPKCGISMVRDEVGVGSWIGKIIDIFKK
jgi:predicted RNA-binding Zn-ribbon protein involved in translation (DUF1610 family)